MTNERLGSKEAVHVMPRLWGREPLKFGSKRVEAEGQIPSVKRKN